VNDGPLIVQSDKTLLLEVDHPSAPDARKAIAPFAELERSPEHIHTYRLTPLGLWNARAAGHDAEQVVDALLTWSRYAVPHALLDAPVIKGETPVKERQRLFNAFRSGEIGLLVVSKVANFSIDLPSAEVAIQVSGSFGSRQEEAQRLGRLLRPKTEGRSAHFYTIVSRDTVDADFAQNRQRFLAEQGYAYRIIDAGDLTAESG